MIDDHDYVDDDEFSYSSEEDWEDPGLLQHGRSRCPDKLPSLRASAEAEEVEERPMKTARVEQATTALTEEPLELEAPQIPTEPWTLIANVALSDITEQDGPFMIVPGSQALSVEETERRLEAGTLALEPVCPMRAGDIFVRNPHCVHRGSASER